MENIHLWAQPLILMTAFIFFWREAKGSRLERILLEQGK